MGIGHFLPQEVVWWDIWIRGLQGRHSSRQQSPWREMQSIIHSNERMQYTSLSQFMAQSHRDQNETGTYVVPDLP